MCTGRKLHQHPAGAQPEPIQIWIFSNKPSSKWFCYYPLSRAAPTAQHARPWSAASLWIMQGASPKFPLSAASTIINAHWKARDLVSKCSCYTRHRSGGGRGRIYRNSRKGRCLEVRKRVDFGEHDLLHLQDERISCEISCLSLKSPSSHRSTLPGSTLSCTFSHFTFALICLSALVSHFSSSSCLQLELCSSVRNTSILFFLSKGLLFLLTMYKSIQWNLVEETNPSACR